MALVATTAAVASFSAAADYVATGPIRGNVCRGVFIQACGTHVVEAVKGDDGKMYTIATRYENVSDYNDKNKLCWIRVKSRDSGPIGWVINAFRQPTFFEKLPDGSMKALDVEYLVFPCEKR